MGKRKKQPENVIKIELNDAPLGKCHVLPIVVKQPSKDGRRVEQTVHEVPTPRRHVIPPTFDPSPAVGDDWDSVFPDFDDPTDGLDSPESVRSYSLSLEPALTQSSL